VDLHPIFEGDPRPPPECARDERDAVFAREPSSQVPNHQLHSARMRYVIVAEEPDVHGPR
jgi:hypothetical protein